MQDMIDSKAAISGLGHANPRVLHQPVLPLHVDIGLERALGDEFGILPAGRVVAGSDCLVSAFHVAYAFFLCVLIF